MASVSKLGVPLLLTRLSIVAFLFPWVAMRFTTPEGSKGIAAKYYKVSNLPDVANLGIGVLWVILLLCVLVGFQRRISYGLVFLFHAVGTAFTIPYLIPGGENFNILFMAAIPTVMAMYLLYHLREHDTLSLDAKLAKN